MKIIVLTISILAFGCLNHTKTTYKTNELSNPFKVYKIDSINNYYLIYVNKKDSLFKIFSDKESVKKCDQIRINVSYDFKLRVFLGNFKIGNTYLKDIPDLNVGGFGVGDSTVIMIEGGLVHHLYYAENIKGLCYFGNR